MNKKSNYLIVIGDNIGTGGVEVYLNNLLSRIDFSNKNIDIYVPGKVRSSTYADKFQGLGCRIILQGATKNGPVRYLYFAKELEKVIKRSKYDVVHINTGNLTIEAISARISKKNAVPCVIAHSHGTLLKGNLVKEQFRDLLRKILNKAADIKLACSENAAISLFGKKGSEDTIIVKNGIDVPKFAYDKGVREAIRNEYGWNEKYVVGSVGRLAEEKNPLFLVEVIKSVLQKKSNSILVVVGDGPLRAILEEEIRKDNLEKKVFLLGERNDVNRLLQGFDVFVLSSIREALGIVNIEAQVSGLPCVVSDIVPREVDINGRTSFLSLSSSYDVWAGEIISKAKFERGDFVQEVIGAGYNIETSIQRVVQIYNTRGLSEMNIRKSRKG